MMSTAGTRAVDPRDIIVDRWYTIGLALVHIGRPLVHLCRLVVHGDS